VEVALGRLPVIEQEARVGDAALGDRLRVAVRVPTTLSWPSAYEAVVSSDQGSAAFRFARFRRIVSYMRCSSGSTYRPVSSKQANVSLPPSFDAAAAVTGTILPPSGRNVRVRPTSRPRRASGPSVSLTRTAS
jgi:hypothetical protein